MFLLLLSVFKWQFFMLHFARPLLVRDRNWLLDRIRSWDFQNRMMVIRPCLVQPEMTLRCYHVTITNVVCSFRARLEHSAFALLRLSPVLLP